MKKNVIGMDMDGVLANFNEGFRQKFLEITGEDKFFEGPFVGGLEPPVWNYPTDTYGYSKEQTKAVWNHIHNESQTFWRDLQMLEKDRDVIRQLVRRALNGDTIYFLTTREGPYVQDQARFWLERVASFPNPSVLICDHLLGKGDLVKGLKITHFFDDKPENCFDAVAAGCEGVFMIDCRYNQWAKEECGKLGIQIIERSSDVLRSL